MIVVDYSPCGQEVRLNEAKVRLLSYTWNRIITFKKQEAKRIGRPKFFQLVSSIPVIDLNVSILIDPESNTAEP